MTDVVTSLTSTTDSGRAGTELGHSFKERLGGAPDAVIVFSSARHDHAALLETLAAASATNVLVGASSAGEFTGEARGEASVSAMAIRSSRMRFNVGIGRGVSRDPAAAARGIASGFRGDDAHAFPYRSALVMTDALAGHTESLLEELAVATAGSYQFFGGGAGDDGCFSRTHVFAGTQALTDAAVALEILSSQPIGIGVSHGWLPASPGLRVTDVDGSRVIGLNGAPAIQAFEDHAARTGQRFERNAPLPFFLHNIFGIETAGNYRLRVPLAVGDDGSVSCAPAIPAGAIVHIMKTSEASAVRAAEQAARAALISLGGVKPRAAIVFDCVTTRLRLGQAFGSAADACATLLKPAALVGCSTYGQIARFEGQFGGFHTCTAVVGLFPE